ncbi:MAG: hypothetical protein AAF420_09825, partial [Pseudomonadota bacterium]
MSRIGNAAIPGAEFLPRGELKSLQRERWHLQCEYVNARSDFYRRRLNGNALQSDIDALVDVPFTDKEMLRQDQREHPPFGSYIAESTTIQRIHRTSGTTGV